MDVTVTLSHDGCAWQAQNDSAITINDIHSQLKTRKQVETGYPQFPELLRLKKTHDPEETFQSEWYRHYKAMFADQL